MLELRWTKSVNVDVWIFFADVPQQVDVPLQAELGMVSPLHQDLNTAHGGKFIQLLIELLQRNDVVIVIFFGAIKRAELAINVADVGVVDVAIDDIGYDF